jgi:hypothetical protein
LGRRADADQNRASGHLAVIDDDRLDAIAAPAERSDGFPVPDVGAARRGGGQQSSDQSRGVEPRVGGKKRDVPDLLGDGEAGLELRRALAADPLGWISARRQLMDAPAQLALGVARVRPS